MLFRDRLLYLSLVQSLDHTKQVQHFSKEWFVENRYAHKDITCNFDPVFERRSLSLQWEHRRKQITSPEKKKKQHNQKNIPVHPSIPLLHSPVASWDFGGICQGLTSTEKNINRFQIPLPLLKKQDCSTNIYRKKPQPVGTSISATSLFLITATMFLRNFLQFLPKILQEMRLVTWDSNMWALQTY